jgi:hypothetical protein
MAYKLKKCPFCAGKAVFVERKKACLTYRPRKKWLSQYEIGCTDMLCPGWVAPASDKECKDGYIDPREVVSKWNTRKEK